MKVSITINLRLVINNIFHVIKEYSFVFPFCNCTLQLFGSLLHFSFMTSIQILYFINEYQFSEIVSQRDLSIINIITHTMYFPASPMEFSLWYPGEPNNDRGREDVVNLLHNEGEWGYNDAYNNEYLRFVCEYEV